MYCQVYIKLLAYNNFYFCIKTCLYKHLVDVVQGTGSARTKCKQQKQRMPLIVSQEPAASLVHDSFSNKYVSALADLSCVKFAVNNGANLGQGFWKKNNKQTATLISSVHPITLL